MSYVVVSSFRVAGNEKALARLGIKGTKTDESTTVYKYLTAQLLPSAPLLPMQCCGQYFIFGIFSVSI
jgi:hypothetical protein